MLGKRESKKVEGGYADTLEGNHPLLEEKGKCPVSSCTTFSAKQNIFLATWMQFTFCVFIVNIKRQKLIWKYCFLLMRYHCIWYITRAVMEQYQVVMVVFKIVSVFHHWEWLWWRGGKIPLYFQGLSTGLIWIYMRWLNRRKKTKIYHMHTVAQ